MVCIVWVYVFSILSTFYNNLVKKNIFLECKAHKIHLIEWRIFRVTIYQKRYDMITVLQMNILWVNGFILQSGINTCDIIWYGNTWTIQTSLQQHPSISQFLVPNGLLQCILFTGLLSSCRWISSRIWTISIGENQQLVSFVFRVFQH